MTKPNPYCECDKWDQPAGICAYCHGYTDGWVEKAALVAERDALATRIEKLRAELQNIFDESDSSEHSIVRVESMAALADQALTEDDALSGKGGGVMGTEHVRLVMGVNGETCVRCLRCGKDEPLPGLPTSLQMFAVHLKRLTVAHEGCPAPNEVSP